MMGERVTDDEPTVVIHEHAHVKALRAPQPEREDVRLPELVRRRALEPARLVLARPRRRRCLDQALVVEDATHLLLRHAERLEPRQHVTDPPGPPRFVFTLQRHYSLTNDRRPGLLGARSTALRRQPRRPVIPERLGPLLHRRRRHAKRLRHLLALRALHPFLDDQQLVLGRDLAATSSLSLLLRHPVSRSADSGQPFGEEGAR